MTQPRQPVRVLVVDNALAQRQLLCRVLARDPELEVVGMAASGAEALREIARLRPDIVSLDEQMPGMGGLETARHIMRHIPTPIVMISTATGSEAHILREAALAVGVLAIQDKRALTSTQPNDIGDLLRLFKGMASVRLVRRWREPAVLLDVPRPIADRTPTAPEIVAIGASTGGPQVLREIIGCLPDNFPWPVLVVQHTTAGYANTLVDWLQNGARLPVRVAEDGEPLGNPGVYIAPAEHHLVVRGRHLTLLDEPPVSFHRPSATVLFRSVAAAYGARSVGIVLTGMGDDGAAGLLTMRQAGGMTIAQDETSSVIFGMPAEAIRLGGAAHVLPPSGIIALLVDNIARGQRAA